MSVVEETQLRGTLLAIEEINANGGINGRELVAIRYDPCSEASAYGNYAKRLMIEDGVISIFGCYTSASRKAVLPVVERLNGLLWYPTPYEGFEASSNIIYTGAAPNQNILELFLYLIKHYGRRFYLVGSDYIYPRLSNRVMRELLRENGGSVVGETYLDLHARRQNFAPVVRELQRLRPDVVFSTVVGEGTVHFYQAFAEAGLDARQMPIASLTTTEAEVHAMGFDVADGHISAAPYFEGVVGATNAAFVDQYKRRYGAAASTNMCVEAAYFQVHLFAKALAQADSLDTDVFRPMVLGTEFEAPQGHIMVDPHSSHTHLWTRIGRVNRVGQFEIMYASQTEICADPFLVGYGRAAAHEGEVLQ